MNSTATQKFLTSMAMSAVMLVATVPAFAQPIMKIDMSTQPPDATAPINIEQNAAANQSQITRFPAGFVAPPPHTPVAELTAYAEWLALVVDTSTPDDAVLIALTNWINEPAPVPVLYQRVAVLLQLGLVPWAWQAAQRLPEASVDYTMGRHAVMWQLLYPQPWGEQAQQTYVEEWRPAMQQWLASNNTQPLTQVWQQHFPPLTKPPTQQWVARWATDIPSDSAEDNVLPMVPHQLAHAISNHWLAFQQALGHVQQGYQTVNNTLVESQLSPAARLAEREAMLPVVAAARQQVRRCPKQLTNASSADISEDWQAALVATNEWCQAQQWALGQLHTAIESPPFTGKRPAVASDESVLDTLDAANEALAKTWQNAMESLPSEPHRLAIQRVLLEAGATPDVTGFVLQPKNKLQPMVRSVWGGI